MLSDWNMCTTNMKDGCALSIDGQFSGLKDKDSLGGLQINGGKSKVIASKEVNNRKRSNGIEIDVLNFCGLEGDHSNTVVLDDSSVKRPAGKEKKKKKRRKISDDCNAEHTKQAENEMSKFGNLGDALENVKSVCTGLDGKSKDAIVLLKEPKHEKKKKKKSYTCQEEDASLSHGNTSQEGYAEKFNDFLTSKVANVNALQGASYTVSLNETCLSDKRKSTSDGLCCEAVRSSNAREIHGNDNIEDKELGGHTVETHKKGSKGSTEPKTVNAFQRGNPDEVDHSNKVLLGDSSVMRPAAKEKKRKKHRKISDDCNAEDTKQVENEMSCKFGNLGDALENVKFVCTGLDGKSNDAIVLLTMPKHGKKKKKKSCTCQEEDASFNHGKASQEGYAEKFNDSLTSKVANVNALQGSNYTVSLNETCLSNKNKKKKSKSNFDGLCCEAVSSLNASEVHADGNIEGKEREGHTAETHKKVSKGSAEPKTVNAFRRVNPDEVTFADERLQNNSYWAKGGAESGYGARAQEVLGQVRGKDFRHEKTKKKRGSYRGGLIDLQSHSIKFSYSDDE